MSDAPATPSSSRRAEAATPEPEPELASSVAAHKAYITQKRKEYLTHMLRNLDIIVYLHLSYMYFLDCSFFRFILRATVQFLFLTPKLINLPLPPHARSPIVALGGASAFAALMHLWEPNPTAGETTHGYIHGGVIIDFIGQKGPISKYRLLYVDAVIVLLQLAMLSLVVARQELLPALSDTDEAVGEGERDLDSEERGEIQSLPVPRLSETLHDSHSDNGAEGEAAEVERTVFEVSSGDFEIARMDIVAVIRRQLGEVEEQPQPSGGSRARAGTRTANWRVLMRGSAGSWRR
ncbi:hypothetical protein FN846DRAFT_748309 [Sphaerosporella brunnea]|uniref:DUF1746 domain-containing protein n=1 Tax=Sphaerosporella brunnea TaxID=1250544 RepID=A0A5J5EVS4_9PEZI|nr:hypothetical protein FN846DRAFT_748309 [Sphaerosporella brunnea]